MKCPKCGWKFTYADAEVEEDWRTVLGLVPKFNGHAKLVSEYVELFGVTPFLVTLKKRARLLVEIYRLFETNSFKWKRAVYEISEKGIIDGLRTTCNANLTTPLKDHNYLRAVLASISMEEKKAARSALDKEQREQEVVRRQDTGDRREEVEQYDGGQQTDDGGLLSPEENRRRAAELASKIGRRME